METLSAGTLLRVSFCFVPVLDVTRGGKIFLLHANLDVNNCPLLLYWYDKFSIKGTLSQI